MDRGGDVLVRHDEFVPSRRQELVVHSLVVAHVAVADRLSDSVTEAARSEIADRLSITQDRLAAEQDDIRIVGDETRQPFYKRAACCVHTCLAADERRILTQFHSPAKACLERVVVGCDV